MRNILLAAAALATISTAAYAAVSFDPTTGTGFVGKGDVQLALGYNNAQIQNATLNFAVSSTVVTEVSWICTNSNNDNIQERERTTTSSVQGVVSSVARVKNQITGYNLTGYSGTPTSSSTSEGNQLNSCPSGPWSLTTPAGDPEVISSSSALTVNGVAIQ